MSETVLAGRYCLVELIGEGGMAHVYRAIDQNTGHNVAIKIMKRELSQDADYVSRFQREAEAASKMTHHNIVNLLDVGMDGNDRYLVMEYVQGITLKQLITEKQRLPAATAAQICIRILSALQHAHEQGIVHRDIKPQNILVANDGHIKVADFGIARIANSKTLTRDDSVMGTVYYYSPEQATGQKVGATSDIYSTGIVLYEMLTGRVPFGGETQVAIAMQHLHAKPTPIEQLAPDVPPAIISVCMRAMAKDPANRYQTARDMAAELRMAMEGRVSEMLPRLEEATPVYPMPQAGAPQAKPQTTKPAKKRQPKPKKQLTPAQQREVRRRVFWWMVTGVVALMVGCGLYVGITSIYEKVVNSTDVPDLVGMELTQAERTATRQGLVVELVEINHPSIAAGTVILQAPEEGTSMRKGDSVVLTVSKGPASMTVPSVVGYTLTDAITTAQASGLTITVVEYVVSGDVQADRVLRQVPEAGATCQSGDIIQVTVSGGLAEVPNVVGESLNDARAALTAAGLSVSTSITYVDTMDPALHGTVASQSPADGNQVIQGTVAYLTVYQVPGLTRSAQVTLQLPEKNETLSVRVMLVIDDNETLAWQGTVEADAYRQQTVTLTAQMAGEYTYRVYCNGTFAYQASVVLE